MSQSNKVAVSWKLAGDGTLNYVSDCGRFVAVYKNTHRSGYGNYWTFPMGLAKRQQTASRAVCFGGKPSFLRVESQALTAMFD